jgi:hypothetical protein
MASIISDLKCCSEKKSHSFQYYISLGEQNMNIYIMQLLFNDTYFPTRKI